MEFKIIDLFKYYLKNYLLSSIVFFITLLIGMIYIFNFYEKEYVAKTTIMLGVCEHICEEADHLNVNFNKAVVNDYMELIKSDTVLSDAIKNANSKYRVSELKKMIKVSYKEDTEYIIIELTSKNENDTQELRNNIYESLKKEVNRIFQINNIHLVDNDQNGSLKYSDKLLIMVVIVLAFITSFLGTTINFLFFPDFNLKTEWDVYRIMRKNKKKMKIASNKRKKNVSHKRNLKK